jgi:hypothetical protein
MNMSSYEIERIDICGTELGSEECTDWYPEAGLQEYSTGQPCQHCQATAQLNAGMTTCHQRL